jgi:hypothetical protein
MNSIKSNSLLAAMLVAALLSGCASIGADVSLDANGSSAGHGEPDGVLEQMARDSAAGGE